MSEVSDRIDLKEIERRAYLSYHGDGLADILVGIYLFIASLYAYVEMIWLAGSMVAIMTPMYMVYIPQDRPGHILKEKEGQVEEHLFFPNRHEYCFSPTRLSLLECILGGHPTSMDASHD